MNGKEVLLSHHSEELAHPFREEVSQSRHSSYPPHSLIYHRWSPRSMSGEKITQEELLHLIEAARWAPSASNNQPWIFIYAHRETPEWDTLFELLLPSNQIWVKNGAVLLLLISKNHFYHNGKSSRTHSFDTGAAWMALALQGSFLGYVVHGMEGFNYEKATKNLQIPEGYTVEAMIVVGKKAPKEKLPPDFQSKEFPSSRKAIETIMKKGTFT